VVLSPPHQRSKLRWSKAWRRWLAGLRQIIETISDKWLNTFGLWLNLRLGRDPLAFADLLAW
jgi:hypothetical protein